MLGGKTPFTGDLMQLIMQKIMHKATPLSSLRTDIPADVERVVMSALEISPADRPASVLDWIEQLEEAAEDVSDKKTGRSRVVIMGPMGSEVYVNDERKASIGSSGRVVLTDVPVGQHILRVSKAGERDDERLIEIRQGAGEQLIQAHLKSPRETTSQPSPSQGSSASDSSVLPGIVACENCGSRFAEGVRFCGRCGGRSFLLVSPGESASNFPCPRCSTPLPQNSRFCGRCGLSITPTTAQSLATPATFTTAGRHSAPSQAERVCKRCGGVYPAHIKFCGRCGGSLL
jgi:RNA polymerase subunit RPABC4/transcription elongation factor Spt4